MGTREEADHFEDLDVDGAKILKYFFKMRNGGMDWIDLGQDRGSLQSIANTVINILVS